MIALLACALISTPTLKTRRGEVLQWQGDEVFLNGKSVAHVTRRAEDAVVVRNLRRLHTPTDEKAFTVCFEPPQLRRPDPAAVERVKAQSELLAKTMQTYNFSNTAWAQAIMTHESGGDPNAISPTGCIGLGGLCELEGKKCCGMDRRDGYRSIYDLCNSEEQSDSYRCMGDERFEPRVGVDRIVDRLAKIDRRMSRLQDKNRRLRMLPEWLVPMVYNAGLGCFPEFPSQTQSIESIMQQLDFSIEPYAEWNTRSQANKAIEIYDYLRWFPHLVEYWKTGTATERNQDAKLVCFHNSGSAQKRFQTYDELSLGPTLIKHALTRIPVRRLSFGRYEESIAYFARTEWEN